MSGIVSVKRHIAKTITWRVVASATTFLLALAFFGNDAAAVQKASGIAAAETVIKMLLYYGHERAWYRLSWGVSQKGDPEVSTILETR